MRKRRTAALLSWKHSHRQRASEQQGSEYCCSFLEHLGQEASSSGLLVALHDRIGNLNVTQETGAQRVRRGRLADKACSAHGLVWRPTSTTDRASLQCSGWTERYLGFSFRKPRLAFHNDHTSCCHSHHPRVSCATRTWPCFDHPSCYCSRHPFVQTSHGCGHALVG